MKKLRLSLEDIHVESFRTDDARLAERGTVQGRNWAISVLLGLGGCVVTALASCDDCTVADTCPDSCQDTCGASCGVACETRYIGGCTSPAAPCYGETQVNLTRCQNDWLEPEVG